MKEILDGFRLPSEGRAPLPTDGSFFLIPGSGFVLRLGADVEVVVSRAEEACRLLYVGDDGDVYQASGGGKTLKLTWGWSDIANPERLYYVWPAYSPDGSQIACFGVRSGSVPEASLFTVANDGIRMAELWRMTESAAPVCESWSPDSRSIALLLQGEDELQLEIAQVHRPGRTIPIDRGAPLFWSWSPRAGYLAVHTGGSSTLYDDARLSIFHVDDECTKIVELEPGEFRTPTWSPDGSRLAYIDASDGGREFLAFYRMDDATIDVVHQVHGQTVMLWSPDGRTLAVSQALGDSPHVYSGLTLIDVESGTVSVIDETELVSFFWSPCSRRMVTMSFEARAGMQWHVLEIDGTKRRLGSNFYPSRELVYFSWFFDQFAASHPLISPDGSRLVFAGHMNERGSLPERERFSERGPLPQRGQSNVYVASLDDDGPVERLAAGHFACWDAQLRANAA